jgi:hypothetical protein
LVLLLGCGTENEPLALTLQADRFASGEWSDPVNLGPVVNTSFVDANVAMSPDEHTMYFVSNRPGGLGGNDIWASHRQCLTCPWEPPYNLGAPINSAAAEGAPAVSENGKLFFFFTTRSDGFGGADIYVSERVSTGADGDVWGEPVNLGPDVNSASMENGSYYTREGPTSFLYFNRPSPTTLDLYRVALSHDGVPLGPALPVVEINSPLGDQKVTVRNDGKELLVSSNRAGSFGSFDIWRSTRENWQDPWSTPANLGTAINTPNIDSQPSLSRDAQTLFFTSDRPGGFGGNDLWMSTRKPGGH